MTVSDELVIAQLKANFTVGQLEQVLKQITYARELVNAIGVNSPVLSLQDKLKGVHALSKLSNVKYLSYRQIRDFAERIRRYELTQDEGELFKDTTNDSLYLNFYIDKEEETGVGVEFEVIVGRTLNSELKTETKIRLNPFFDINVLHDDTPYTGIEEKNVAQAIKDIKCNTKVLDNEVRVEPNVAHRLEKFKEELELISAKYGVYIEECGNVCYTIDDMFGKVTMTFHKGKQEGEIWLITDAIDNLDGEQYL